MERHLITLYALDRRRAEESLPGLARALDGGTVGSLDAAGMVEIELSAGSRDEALARVRDAIAALGAEERFTFPETTGTGHAPPGRRGAPPDEQPPTNPLTSSAAARARMGRHPPDSSKVATPKEEPMAQDIASVMTADPITVDGNAALLDAARAMRDNDVGDVLVTENGAVAGI